MNVWRLTAVQPTVKSVVLSLFSAFVIAITFQLFLHLKDAYDFAARPSTSKFLLGLLQAILLASVVLFAIHMMVPGMIVGAANLAITLVSTSMVLTTWH